MNNIYKLYDRAIVILCASAGLLALLVAAYQLIANGVLYWHIFVLGTAFIGIADMTKEEANNE